ncbi:MAG: hypothetical protein ACFBSF_18425 [Leptolyngbyaceae cyanobacterium]
MTPLFWVGFQIRDIARTRSVMGLYNPSQFFKILAKSLKQISEAHQAKKDGVNCRGYEKLLRILFFLPKTAEGSFSDEILQKLLDVTDPRIIHPAGNPDKKLKNLSSVSQISNAISTASSLHYFDYSKW